MQSTLRDMELGDAVAQSAVLSATQRNVVGVSRRGRKTTRARSMLRVSAANRTIHPSLAHSISHMDRAVRIWARGQAQPRRLHGATDKLCCVDLDCDTELKSTVEVHKEKIYILPDGTSTLSRTAFLSR